MRVDVASSLSVDEGVIPEDEERRLARSPLHVPRAPMAQKGTGRFSENVIRTDKSALLWMYCREIAPFETPAFSENVGNLIAPRNEAPLRNAQSIRGKLGH